MKQSGYAGARHMFKQFEHLYGFQATTAEKMDGTFRQNTFDVYLADKHGLELEKFFQKENPHAYQLILSRLIEVDRQGNYTFSEQEPAALVEKYVHSVNVNGVSCSANTCGNERVNQYLAQQAPLVRGLGNQELREFGRRVAQATRWSPVDFRSAPPALRAGMIQGLAPSRPVGATQRRETPKPRAAARNYVSGYQMQERVLELGSQSPLPKLIPLGYLLVIASLITFGAARELLSDRKRHP